MNVGAQRLERRDVEDAGLVGERRAEPFLEQLIETREKRRERLARSRRRRDERVPSGLDLRPPALLRKRRRAERLVKPACDNRMKGRNLCSLPRSRPCQKTIERPCVDDKLGRNAAQPRVRDCRVHETEIMRAVRIGVESEQAAGGHGVLRQRVVDVLARRIAVDFYRDAR